MKKITENALLFRVNQLHEILKLYEDEAGGLTKAEMDKNAKIAQKAAADKAATPPVKQANDQAPAGVNVKPYQGQMSTVPPATPPTGEVQPKMSTNPNNNGGTTANNAINNMLGSKTTTTPPTAPPAAKWPTTDAEIKAFQQVNKDQFGKPLAVDGKIGAQTMQALAKAGLQPPAGFQMVGNKQHAAPHPTTHPVAHQGTAAKPAAQSQSAENPEDAARNARIAQNQAFYSLSPEDQAAINQAHGQQALKTAAATQAAQTQAAPQTATTPANPNDPTNSIGKAVANAIPNAAPSSALTAQGPLGVNFQSQQVAPQLHQGQGNGTVGQVDDSDNNLPPIPKNESVSFANEDSLTRILQLAKW